MEQYSGLANQQGVINVSNVTEAEIGWLAGMIDGAGNISCGLRENPNGAKYLDVKVRISGTDIRIIHHIGVIYQKFGLVFFNSLMNKNIDKWKTGLNVEVSRQGSTLKLLRIMAPHLKGKHLVAESLIKVIKYVQSVPAAGNGTRRDYCEHDEFKRLYADYMREFAWYYDPSTTTRRAGEPISLDGIV